MRDLFMVGVLALLFLAAFKRPFLMTLGYIYTDIVQPQQVSWYLLNSVPVSMIFGASAVLFYLLFDDKRNIRFGPLQWLMLLFLVWVTFTTTRAQLPLPAWQKWDPAWKAIGFAIFLPLVLQTRLRIEAAMMFLVLCIGTITITGGVKTLLGGGGYGTLNLLVDSNTGLYEGSTISAVAISIIPLILYLYHHNQIVPRSRLTWLLTAGLIFASLLIPIGTEARTGLVCIAVLAGLWWLGTKHKLVYMSAVGLVALMALPLLPTSFTGRMATIETYTADASASTRLAVWGWTLDFVKEHPLGGGFGVYRLNEVKVQLQKQTGEGPVTSTSTAVVTDRARAFHSAYFEVLGEQGYPGLAIFLTMAVVALVQLRRLYKRFVRDAENQWVASMARALGFTLIIYMVGSLFVGIGFQSTQYYIYALTAALVQVASSRMPARQPVPPRPLWKTSVAAAQ